MGAFDDTLGTLLIGVLFATFLQGMLTLQMYFYYDGSSKDPLILRLLVFTVWSLDLIHLALISHGLYHYTVTNWGIQDALLISTWQLDSHVAVTGVTSFLCQMFFLHRLWVLSGRNWFVVVWPFLGAAASCALDIVITADIIMKPAFAEFAKTTPEAIGTFSLTAATDLTIAVLLCFYLSQQKTQFRRTQTLVRKVMQYTITTGLFTSVVAIASLVAFVLAENTFIFFSTYFSLGSLYTNSVLASLNTRKSLKNSISDELSLSIPDVTARSRSTPARTPIRAVVTIDTIDDRVPMPMPTLRSPSKVNHHDEEMALAESRYTGRYI